MKLIVVALVTAGLVVLAGTVGQKLVEPTQVDALALTGTWEPAGQDIERQFVDGSWVYRETGSHAIAFNPDASVTPTPVPSPTPTPTSPPTETATPTPTQSPSPSPTASPSPTPTPTLPPATGVNLTAPIRATFTYHWYPEGWSQFGIDPFTKFHPTRGFYSSDDAAVIDAHISDMQLAGIKVGFASWWGVNQKSEQTRFPKLMAEAQGTGFAWAVYYERDAAGDPTPAEIAADLTYIYDEYVRSGTYAFLNSKPVIAVFNAGATDGCSTSVRWRDAQTLAGLDFYVMLKVFPGFASCAVQPEAWHQYGPSTAQHSFLPYSFNVSPGFWLASEATPRLARDIVRFRTNIRNMIVSGATWQLVTSFNEWGEGTSIEPATEWGQDYLEALRTNGAIPPTPSPTANPSPSPTATVSPTPSPTSTPTAPVGSVTLIGAGDIASSGSGDTATAALLAANPADVVFTLGDNAYQDGSAAQFASYYEPTWGAYRAQTRPVSGNHDQGTALMAGYCGFFGSSAGPCSAETAYYSYDAGEWRVYVLNSSCYKYAHLCSPTGAQIQWLRADLTANPRECTIVMFHHARWSSGDAHGSDAAMGNFWNVMYEFGVDLNLVGHEHIYERFARQTPGGVADPVNGVRQITVGTGGMGRYGIGTVRANSEVRATTAFGVLKLELSPGAYTWRFLPASGATFSDSGTESCH